MVSFVLKVVSIFSKETFPKLSSSKSISLPTRPSRITTLLGMNLNSCLVETQIEYLGRRVLKTFLTILQSLMVHATLLIASTTSFTLVQY